MKWIKRFLSVLALALLCVALLLPSPASADDAISALFINVGKADAHLLFLGDARYLIDTGTKGSYDQLARVLETYGVSRLDGVIITHTDKDHAGGLKKLLKGGMQVDMLYAGALHSEKSLDDHPVYEAAEKYAAPLTWLSAGDEIPLDNGCVLRVLGPLTRDAENENNNSLVILVQTPQGDMLFAGDMELEEEAELLAAGLIAQAPVLKVAHHGEDDSTSRAFALTVKPQWAIIPTNSAEEPDTPDSKIISRLWEAKADIAVTQGSEVGVLVVLEDGDASAESINWK